MITAMRRPPTPILCAALGAVSLAGVGPAALAQQTGDGVALDDEAPENAAGAAPVDGPADDPSSGGLRRVPRGVAEAAAGAGSSYPTVALADYVLGCMVANGSTHEALQQCSCSIDYIRERMDWADYEKANTVMQVQLDRGQRGIFYRDSNWAKTAVGRLQELQAESTLRCF